MTGIRRFGHFWWHFVVGDDWRLALGAVTGLTATWFAAHHDRDWFWILPVVVLSTLVLSLRRTTRPPSRRRMGAAAPLPRTGGT